LQISPLGTYGDHKTSAAEQEHNHPGESMIIMDSNATPNTHASADEIQEWIVNYLATELKTQPEEIDVAIPFEEFALDSMTAISLSGDLERWTGKKINPTVVYDYPTIEELAQFLAGEEGSD
jgi:acyl carrier protein